MVYDATKPVTGNASTANVRHNFSEIELAGIHTNLLNDKNPAFDSWSAGAAVARSADEEYGDYAAQITYGAADAYLYTDLTEFAYYQDKYVSLSARIKTSTAGIARLTISDGVGSTNSAYHTGGGTYETIKVTHQCNGAATQVRIELHVTGAGNAIFDCIVLAEGSIQAEAFPPPIFGSLSSAAYAYLSAAQLNIADTTETVVQLDTENYDVGSDFNTTTYRFVAPQAGYYNIAGQIRYQSLIANKRYYSIIKKNNTTNILSNGVGNGTQTVGVCATATGLVYLAAADYIELIAYVDCGAATVDIVQDPTYTHLIVYLVAAA